MESSKNASVAEAAAEKLNATKDFVPPSARRVPRHTRDSVQRRIREKTVANIASCITTPEKIDSRLAELDREWDTERTLELNASLLALSGAILGRFVNRKWLYLSMGVTGFLAQHAVQGWCPPLPVLRRMGFRTRKEIEQERSALQMIRRQGIGHIRYNDVRLQAEALLLAQEE